MSGRERSYPSVVSSSGDSIAAGSWATGVSRACNRESTISIELARPRQRNSDEFFRLRGKILEQLHFAGSAVHAAG